MRILLFRLIALLFIFQSCQNNSKKKADIEQEMEVDELKKLVKKY